VKVKAGPYQNLEVALIETEAQLVAAIHSPEAAPSAVLFTAQWATVGRPTSTAFFSLASELHHCKFYKVDVDESAEVAAAVGIRAVPTIMVFKGGKKAQEVSGTADQATIKAWLL
jgi:thioredoxin 1